MSRRKELDLFLASIAVILFETLAIRWVGTNIKVIGYFGNLVLIACFLGLGCGLLLERIRWSLATLIPVALAAFVGAVRVLGQFNLVDIPQGEHLHIYSYDHLPVPHKLSFFALVIAIFVATAAACVPLGQVLGRLFAQFERRLTAYAIHLAGNVAGAILFVLLSYLWTPPWVWFACLLALALNFSATGWKGLAVTGATSAAVFLALTSERVGPVDFWSPYYHVQLRPLVGRPGNEALGYSLLVDGQRHQDSLALSSPAFAASTLAWWRTSYETPYRFSAPNSLLILGSGSGNDVHLAVEHGVERIRAVEIDPAIIEVGRSWHPHRPYANWRVDVANDDARAFLTNTRERFDLALLAVLDSHRLATNIAVGLRLDNFVYTVEAFRLVRERLYDHGALVLQNGGPPWLLARTYNSLAAAFGHPPDVYAVDGVTWFVHFVVGKRAPNPAPASWRGLKRLNDFGAHAASFGLLEDNWPYLYLQGRAIPKAHLQMLMALLVLSALSILAFYRLGRRPMARTKGRPRMLVHFFALGAAFLLLETASISRAAVLFGSSWLTSSAIIMGVLFYAFLANVAVLRWPRVRLEACYGLLLAALLACYLLPMGELLGYSLGARLLLGGLVLGLPFLFAGAVFSSTFAGEPDGAAALAINLFGAILGGLLEHLALVTGTRELYLVALVLYLVSFVTVKWARSAEPSNAAALSLA